MLYQQLLMATVCVLTGSVSVDTAAVQNQREGRFLLEGMLSAREQLRSGVFRTVSCWLRSDLHSAPENAIAGKVQLFCAFDVDRIRFDRKAPGWVVDRDGPKKDLGNHKYELSSKKGVLDEKFFRTVERSGYWFAGNDTISLVSAATPPMGSVKPFDIRAVGLYSWLDMEQGTPVKQMVQSLLEGQNETVVESLPDGVKLLKMYVPNAREPLSNETKLWIDTHNGFTAKRLELSSRTREDGEWKVNGVYETTWQQREDVWVPIEWTMNTRSANRDLEVEFRASIAWESVNQLVDGKLFTYQAFDAPESVSVVDSSLGTPVVVKYGNTPSPGRAAQAAGSGWRWWIVGAVCVGVVCFAVVLRARQRAA